MFKEKQFETRMTFKDKDKFKNSVRYEHVKVLYDEYLNYGGFPQVVLENDYERKKLHLEDIFKSYFERDIQGLAKFREIRAFRDLILLLMPRVGSKLDIARLAAELGISRHTVYSYLTFLESTYFITLVSLFTKSKDKLVSKAKKVYFCDSGMLNVFAKIDEGALFENAVFNNLRAFEEIRYYGGSREIDFVVNGLVGLEVKLKGIDRDIVRLRGMVAKLGLKEAYVVTKQFVDKEGFIAAIDL